MSNDPLKNIWRAQATEVPDMSATYIRHRASELQRGFRLRNLFEQGSSIVALVACAVLLFVSPGFWFKAALVMLLIGGMYALTQWRRRTASLFADPASATEVAVVFYRRELERKRDIHRTLWRWYLVPFLPGSLTLLGWMFFGDPQTRGTPAPWFSLALLVAFVTFSFFYERSKAAQCQREIDALPSAENGASAAIQGSKR